MWCLLCSVAGCGPDYSLWVTMGVLYGSVVAMVSSMAWSLWSHYVSWQHGDHSLWQQTPGAPEATQHQGQESNSLPALRRLLRYLLAPLKTLTLLSRCLNSVSQLMFVLWHLQTITMTPWPSPWRRRLPSLLWLGLESWQHCHQWNADPEGGHQVASVTNESSGGSLYWPIRGRLRLRSGDTRHLPCCPHHWPAARAQVTTGPWSHWLTALN